MSIYSLHALAVLAVVQLVAPGPNAGDAQSFRAGRARRPQYQVTTIYDRVTDSTRVTVTLPGSSRPLGLGSRVWADFSFTYAGRRLSEQPETVVLTLESFTPARGGWAFARPQDLRVRAGNALELKVSPARYERRKARLFDSGRRELLSFSVPLERLTALAAEPGLDLESGGARFRLREHQMELLRDYVTRLKPASPGAR